MKRETKKYEFKIFKLDFGEKGIFFFFDHSSIFFSRFFLDSKE